MGTGLVGRSHVLVHARSLAADRTGVLFVGEPGVGKTRLLTEVLDLLESDGWHTERLVASTAARTVPFGALISLLPSGATDRTQQIAGVRRTLVERADRRPTALSVDDAHLLDDASLACLVDLAHHSEVVVLGSARSTEPLPSDLTALWASEALDRIDVEPLQPADATELASQLLGDPVTHELATQLWDRTRGIPLFVRELLLDATSQDLLSLESGTWSLHRDLRPGARLNEIVRARTAALSTPAQALLELLAIAEPVAMELLTAEEGVELDVLEQGRLARVEQLGGRWVATVDHPLITEAIAAAIPTRRRLDLVRAIAHRTVEAGCPAPGDALRAAAWFEECGDPLPAAAALAAGREALTSLDLDRACDLAGAVLEEAPGEAHLLLGEALRLQARADEAEDALAIAEELADDDETIVRVAMWRSTLLAHHADDPKGALTLLNAAADRVEDPERAVELRSEAAFIAGILGRFDVAVDANRRILATDDLDGPTRWTALMNLLFGQVMLADLSDIDATLDAMAELIDVVGPDRPEGIDLYWALVASVWTLRGELARCESELVAHVQRCVAAEQLHGLTAAILVFPLLYRGSAHAMTMAAAACEATAVADAYMVGPIAHAGHTLAVANTGDLDAARAALADIDMSHTGDLRLDGFIGRARAAVLALEGRWDDAAEAAASSGRLCVAGTYVEFGIVSLYDAVRYRRADLVVDDMRPLGGASAAPLVEVMVRHAIAQDAGDTTTLMEVAEGLAAMGARGLVAEALDDVARLTVDEVLAARASTTAALWRRATPAPNARVRPEPSPVSERELDVVVLALTGMASKAIAEALFLSVRTVDNHLAQVYRKLAVKGRAELAAALTPPPPVTA